MAKYPREEVSYKKIYKKLDLDRDLGIEFPKVNFPDQVEVIDESNVSRVKESYEVDEDDIEFCQKNEISNEKFLEVFNSLDKAFLSYIYKRLDKIRTIKSKDPCDICGRNKINGETERITCQGCNVTVHKSCYAIIDDSKRRWLCRSCIFYFEEKTCKFCQRSDGTMKKFNNGDWGHLVCVMLNQSLAFCNDTYKEPIEVVDSLAYEGICSICQQQSSYLIKCSFDCCKTYYHTSCCAENCYSDLGNGITYCDEHSPLKNYKKILSKRSILNHDHGYADIEQKVCLRSSKKFYNPKDGQFLKIVKSKPKIFISKIKKLKNDPSFRKISEFWKTKRGNEGYFFDDIFIFSNRFLKTNKKI